MHQKLDAVQKYILFGLYIYWYLSPL